MLKRNEAIQIIGDLRAAKTHLDKLKVVKGIQKRHPEIARRLKASLEEEHIKEMKHRTSGKSVA